jgi:2-haloacid dehalogenase
VSKLDGARPEQGVLRYQDSDGDAIIALIPTFGPFPEVPEALRHLKNRYEIAIMSNTPRTA